jgi:Fuc2NAc and GlcNAc transferase
VIWGAPAIAFVVSLLAVMGVERHAVWLRLIDRPNERSSHVVPRPRGGGLGIIAGTCAGLGMVWLLGAVIGGGVWIVILGAGIVAVVGLWDDVASLSPLPRLVAQSGAAVLVIWGCGAIDRLPLPSPLDIEVSGVGVVLSVLWIVAVTNFFNFMDGADGLAAGQAAITLGAVGFVLSPSGAGIAAVVSLAATLGFLVRNWAPARIFLGDVGSGWLGFLIAALPFASDDGSGALVLLVATSLALFLVDPTLTLILRWRRGAHVTVAHREHLYQRLVMPERSHGRPVAMILALAGGLALVAVVIFREPGLGWLGIAAAGMAAFLEWKVAMGTEVESQRHCTDPRE